MRSKNIFITAAVIVFLGAVAMALMYINTKPNSGPANSVAAGTPLPSSSSLADQIKVDSPAASQSIASPLVVRGQARGGWYFEASFPVRLLDGNGKEIVRTAAAAQGDWMTASFVPFVATLQFAPPATANGTLVLAKDNPSGRPEADAEIRIPIKFKQSILPKPTATELSACEPSGCSGEICSDQNVVSACVYKSEYACYKYAACERQTNGKCGWTMTPDLKQCLAQGGL